MKKITIILSMIFAFAFTADAQYYYYPHILIGQNPGGVNTDIEQPNATGWATIQTTSATPVWGAIQTLPFTFSLNGTPFTQYKMASSGVLTFTTTAVAVPGATSAALPSASIPDNSICVWGLAASGANDQIRTKVFGTTPNRQYWVQFSSYSCPSSTGWTYWGIVLQETSNKVFIVDQRNYNAPLALSCGIQVNSTTAYSVVGSPNITSYTTAGGSLDDATDNTYYEFVYGTQPAWDAELSSAIVTKYILSPANINITGTVTNLGTSTITGLTIKYQNGANIYTDVRTGLNIAPAGTWNFTHITPFNVATPNQFPLSIWVELSGDANTSNDMVNKTVSGLAFLPSKNILFEEATGTWCGWCPRGAVFMDSLAVVHPTRAMLVAVHNGDPMVVSAYDAGIGNLVSGYPEGVIDRKYVDDPSVFFSYYNQLINDTIPVSVSVATTIVASTRVATIVMTATAAGELSGDFRFSGAVTEEDVVGATSQYNQVNYYSYMSQNIPLVGAGHNWQNEPNPVAASNMQYDHVGRALLGGFNGQAASLPASMIANGQYTYTFNYTVPAAYNLNNLKFLGWVSDFSTKEVFNTGLSSVSIITGVDETPAAPSFHVNVFPNPMSAGGNVQLELVKAGTVKMEIVDMHGRTVLSLERNLASGKHFYDLNQENLSSGLYNVKVTVGDESVSTRFVVSK